MLAWTSLLLAAVGAAAGGIGYALTLNEADAFLDGQLRQVALNAGAAPRLEQAPPPADVDPEDAVAVAVWRGDAAVRSDLPGPPPPRPGRAGYGEIISHGLAWRTYVATGGGWTVLAAQRLSVRRSYARGAAIGTAAPILLVIPLSWATIVWALSRALARLDRPAREMVERSAAAAEPMPLAQVPGELVPFVDAANGLILRLRVALDGQKRFLADAAHELRTPLAAIRLQLDNLATASPHEVAARREAIGDGMRRAETLVSGLLRLAQLDEPTVAAKEPVELEALLLDCLSELLPIAAAKQIDLGATIGTQALIEGTPSELRSLFEALVENALRYTPPGGTVDARMVRDGGAVVIEVLDDGPGLPPGAEARIFERFHRAAPAGIEGTGLGLAIARRVAERHGLELSVANRGDGVSGVRAMVVVPC